MKTTNLRIAVGLAIVYVVWGSTYLAIRIGVETMPPFLLAGIRFIVGGLMLYGWARFNGARKPKKSHWTPAVILGILMPVGGTGLVTWAELSVPSGLTALLVAMAPMWMVLGDWLQPGGTRPRLTVGVGLLLGFVGVALLIDPINHGGSRELDLFGALLIVVATVSWAAGSVYSKSAGQPESKVLSVAMQMLTGGVGLILLAGVTGEIGAVDLGSVTISSWLALGYLTTAGSIAFAVYIWLISAAGVAKAATYAYVNPVLALILGALLAGETLSMWTLYCSAIIIVAIVIIITARTRPTVEIATATSPASCADVTYPKTEVCK